jgi:hypothetical protein
MLENYTFLTTSSEIKKSNLYWVSRTMILGRFSNTVAVEMGQNT